MMPYPPFPILSNRCIFKYLRSLHVEPAICRNLAATNIRADSPSGKEPMRRVLTRISLHDSYQRPLLVRIRFQCLSRKSMVGESLFRTGANKFSSFAEFHIAQFSGCPLLTYFAPPLPCFPLAWMALSIVATSFTRPFRNAGNLPETLSIDSTVATKTDTFFNPHPASIKIHITIVIFERKISPFLKIPSWIFLFRLLMAQEKLSYPTWSFGYILMFF